MKNFLKKTKEGQIVCVADSMTTYVPALLFDESVAERTGRRVTCFGEFFVGFRLTASQAKESLFHFDIGLDVSFLFEDSFRTEKTFDGEKDEYWAFTLGRDEVWMDGTTYVESLDSAENFMRYLNQAKLPRQIKYEEFPHKIRHNLAMNGVGVPLPDMILEAMASEMMRSKDDEHTPFRFVAGRTGKTTGYAPMKLKDLPNLNSVFAGLSFENMDKAIQSGVDMTRSGRPQRSTPLEDVLRQ